MYATTYKNLFGLVYGELRVIYLTKVQHPITSTIATVKPNFSDRVVYLSSYPRRLPDSTKNYSALVKIERPILQAYARTARHHFETGLLATSLASISGLGNFNL